jgi:hypothetical protein
MKTSEITNNDEMAVMSDEREEWSMWDPAIPVEAYRQMAY